MQPGTDPQIGWGIALTFASVFPGAGAVLGAEILRVYVSWLGMLGVLLGVLASIATVYERVVLARRSRQSQ